MIEVTENKLFTLKQRATKVLHSVIQAKATLVEVEKNINTSIDSFIQYGTTHETYDDKITEISNDIRDIYEKKLESIDWCEKIIKENSI